MLPHERIVSIRIHIHLRGNCSHVCGLWCFGGQTSYNNYSIYSNLRCYIILWGKFMVQTNTIARVYIARLDENENNNYRELLNLRDKAYCCGFVWNICFHRRPIYIRYCVKYCVLIVRIYMNIQSKCVYINIFFILCIIQVYVVALDWMCDYRDWVTWAQCAIIK